MTPAPYDQNIANGAAAVDQCMKLGAVVLKPKTEPRPGFLRPDEPH